MILLRARPVNATNNATNREITLGLDKISLSLSLSLLWFLHVKAVQVI